MAFTKYDLSESQLVKIARLCVQEQGNIEGCKAEASLMANLLETSPARQKKYGTGADGLYNWVRNGPWFSRAAHWMDYGHASEKAIDAVRDVLVNGNRTLPQYVDEHDCISDILSISTGSKSDRSDYIKNKTIIKNCYGSTYTFWCFPAPGCDPFGYTKPAYEYVMKHGGDAADPEPENQEERDEVITTLPEIGRGCEGDAVAIWQIIVGTKADGDFGPATQDATIKWQTSHNLKGDGIVGARTWAAGLKSVKCEYP